MFLQLTVFAIAAVSTFDLYCFPSFYCLERHKTIFIMEFSKKRRDMQQCYVKHRNIICAIDIVCMWFSFSIDVGNKEKLCSNSTASYV